MTLLYALLLLLFFVLILLLIAVNQVRDKSESRELKILEAYIPIYEASFEDFRKLNHDFINHFNTIKLMKENPTLYATDDVYKNYIAEIENTFKWDHMSAMQSSFLMMFLYSWSTRLSSHGFSLHIGETIKADVSYDNAYEPIVHLNEFLLVLVQIESKLPMYTKVIAIDEGPMGQKKAFLITLNKALYNMILKELKTFTHHKTRNAYYKIATEISDADTVQFVIL